MKTLLSFLLPAILLFLSSCAVQKNYNPAHKFSPEELREDYTLFRNILETSHPSLYWYTPKDSIDYYFEEGARRLTDSLPEYKFRNILTYVIAKIRCGHTSVRASRGAVKYSERTRSIAFPLNIKTWDDTVVLTSNLNRRDSQLTRGMILTAIDGKPVKTLIDSFFQHFSADGYNTTHKYQTLSNAGNFRNLYGSFYGLKPKTRVDYIDTAGHARSTIVSLYNPAADTPRTRPSASAQPAPPAPSRRERRQLLLQSQRSLRIDTALHTAFMEVNSFTKQYRLRRFFRKSFRTMRREEVPNLVVDIRGNGGGSVVLSNLLTKYIADQPFKIADSLYAIRSHSPYGRYQSNYLPSRLFFLFMAHRKKDGHYHFSLFENRYFQPKHRNHFKGDTYILTGGNTFSAASLFAKALREQTDVTIVGEETGGGAYGNTAWLIPDVTLPHTKVRFRLPLFRLVIDKNEVKGRGVMPEVEAPPTVNAIRRNADYKMEKAIELIRKKH